MKSLPIPGVLTGTLGRTRRFLSRSTGYSYRPGEFGLHEAVVFAFSVDVWQRYSAVCGPALAAQNGDNRGRLSILDVGGGSGEILTFLSPSRYDICVLDANQAALKRDTDRRVRYVPASGESLPFEDDSFDVVVSVDCIEHVPEAVKPRFLAELKRVARKRVVIHTPAKSADRQYLGDELDERFNRWHRRLYRVDAPNTREHLEAGVPELEELASSFPGAKLTGSQNAETWYLVMRVQRLPFVALFTGLMYWLLKRQRDKNPPFHGCLLVWDKDCLV